MHPTKNLLMALVTAASLATTASAATEPGAAFSLDRRDSSAGGTGVFRTTAPAGALLSLPTPSRTAISTGVSEASVLTDPFSFLTGSSSGDSSVGDDSARSGDLAGSDRPAGDAKSAKKAADGGLDVPRINQNTGGGRYPRVYCGPTSVRMVLAYFGTKISADQAAKGVYIRGDGASHEGMAKKLRSYGVKATLTHTRNLASLKAAIDRGHPVIINVRGNYGPRSTGGHIIVVVGFDRSGNPIINDPAGGGRHVCPRRKFVNAWNGLMIEASK